VIPLAPPVKNPEIPFFYIPYTGSIITPFRPFPMPFATLLKPLYNPENTC